MQAALKQREQQFGGLRGSVMKEKDEELALFLEMKKREKERNDLLLHNSDELDSPLGIDFLLKKVIFCLVLFMLAFWGFGFFRCFFSLLDLDLLVSVK